MMRPEGDFWIRIESCESFRHLQELPQRLELSMYSSDLDAIKDGASSGLINSGFWQDRSTNFEPTLTSLNGRSLSRELGLDPSPLI